MTTDECLYRACWADPADNTPRLVFADWLDENGITDQHRARSEWIRKFCIRHKYTNRRQSGEGYWIRTNFHRLWPNVFYQMNRHTFNVKFDIKLLSGKIILSIPYPGANGESHNWDRTVVVLSGERGITRSVTVTWLRANAIVPLVARDEPYADFEFAPLPQHVFNNRLSGCVRLYRDKFKSRGLEPVFDRLASHGGNYHANIRFYPYGTMVIARGGYENTETGARIRAALDMDRALTNWAHNKPIPTGANNDTGNA